VRLFLGLVCLIAAVNATAQIGTVSDHKGNGCEIQRDKTKLTGNKGTTINTMDTYVTSSCSSNIVFKDDTKLKITENSRVLIDDFVYDPKASDAGKLAVKVGMGTVRYASGQIAKNNPQRVAVNTPTATIAVRGTDFTMTVDETGESLIVLVPSCKDESEQKKYELEENRCRVGRIEVSTQAGTVILDKAFEATYVVSSIGMPTPPVILNTVETSINNNLIIARPQEVQLAIKQQARTKREDLDAELESEAQRRISQTIKKTNEELETARIIALAEYIGKAGCNPSTSVCVVWERNDVPDIQSKGKGVAFRSNEDHYAEVKTSGYSSNTFVSITHNDQYADTVIGDGSPSGNIVKIIQNTGVLRRP